MVLETWAQQMKYKSCKTYHRSVMYRISYMIMQGLHKSAEMIQILFLRNNQLEIFGKNFCPSNISIKALSLVINSNCKSWIFTILITTKGKYTLRAQKIQRMKKYETHNRCERYQFFMIPIFVKNFSKYEAKIFDRTHRSISI